MGALQGIGTPAGFASQPAPWSGLMQDGYPSYAPSLTPQLSGISLAGYPGTTGAFGLYPPQQVLQWLQVAIQQAVHVVPLQLHQIQQLVQLLLAQQQLYPTPYAQGLQPFQTTVGQSPWFAATQSSHAQPFGGQPAYVM